MRSKTMFQTAVMEERDLSWGFIAGLVALAILLTVGYFLLI
jgi:hypothetical protein